MSSAVAAVPRRPAGLAFRMGGCAGTRTEPILPAACKASSPPTEKISAPRAKGKSFPPGRRGRGGRVRGRVAAYAARSVAIVVICAGIHAALSFVAISARILLYGHTARPGGGRSIRTGIDPMAVLIHEGGARGDGNGSRTLASIASTPSAAPHPCVRECHVPFARAGAAAHHPVAHSIGVVDARRAANVEPVPPQGATPMKRVSEVMTLVDPVALPHCWLSEE